MVASPFQQILFGQGQQMALRAGELAWYPGHCLVETALFERKDATGDILLDHNICKRGPPLSENEPGIVLLADQLDVVSKPIPHGALQIIRFVGLAPGGPEGEEQKRDRRLLKAVFEAYKIPVDYVQFALESGRVELGRYLVGDKNEVENEDFVFYAKGRRYLAIWRFQPKEWSIRLVIVTFAPPNFELLGRFIPLLHRQIILPMQQCFGHPMLPVLLLIEMLRLDILESYQNDSSELRSIENELTVKSAHRLSTMQTLRDLGRMANQDKYVVLALKLALEMGRKVNTSYYPDKAGAKQELVALHFLLHVDRLDLLLDLDLAFLDNIVSSVSHQQNAISTIINLSDSSSMKTIAVLTLLFLPSTLMAAIFAMPVFPAQRADEFWIYWAVSLPLTITVIVIWSGLWYWHKIQRYYDDPEQSSLGDLKIWWKRLGSGHETATERKKSYHQGRRKLGGDTYKEWISRFNEATRESAEKRANASGRVQPVNGYQSV